MAINGVYCITNTVTNKVYIGSSASKGGIKERCRHHKSDLKRNKHCNKYLQHAYNQYGPSAFSYKILEECSKEQCLEREQYYMDLFQSYDPDKGYNLCKIAGNTLGRAHSVETRKKIGQSRVYPVSPNKGKKLPYKTCHKISDTLKNSPKLHNYLEQFNKTKRIPVIGVNLITGEIIELEHAGADPRFFKSGINMCCRGKIPHYKGFKWSYK